MKRQNLKFLIFLIILGLIIVGLVLLEEIRDHPDYAPMFSGMFALPMLWLTGRRGLAVTSVLTHPHTALHESIK
ncbi:MAG: hypothetical protein LAT62_13985 [Natronospirillum sp.]|uniref:hypothetical protein n=1 Tax=Natronospirillum sp. TaxID=2812955 RepID=UPI0025CDC066|nr:hypothetical protein [Natronospirillum sp.]MCH8553042.1 hypothetical protein [Natronospirillum sp.]